MKFNCGPTQREKHEALKRWHPWFAWYPVRFYGVGDYYWLERVERKGAYHDVVSNLLRGWWSWENRPREARS